MSEGDSSAVQDHGLMYYHLLKKYSKHKNIHLGKDHCDGLGINLQELTTLKPIYQKWVKEP